MATRTPTPAASSTPPSLTAEETAASEEAAAEKAAAEKEASEKEAAVKEAADKAAAEKGAAKDLIEARILVDHAGYTCDTLALLTEEQAADCAGWADTSEAAVAYMKSRG